MSQTLEAKSESDICSTVCPLRSCHQDLGTDTPLPSLSSDLPWTLTAAARCQIYDPIREWQTRLLILEPGDAEAILKGRLVVVNIIQRRGVVIHGTNERQSYDALSYTWGVPKFPRTILLNSVVFPITDNLFAFLKRYRQGNHRGTALWVDALCIDQLDLEEKAVQITNMLVIYEKAAHVIVWLGEHGKHTRLAMEYAEEFSRSQDCIHSNHCEGTAEAFMQGIQDLVTRDWSSRIWIRQEIWAASNIAVMCGISVISWETFNCCAEMRIKISARGDQNVPGQNNTLRWLSPRISRDKRQILKSLKRHDERIAPDERKLAQFYAHPIFALISNSLACQCSVPLDRIYALLGMASITARSSDESDDRSSFEINYDASEAMVFRHLARWVVLNVGATALFNTLGTFGSLGHIHLPSWTPNWTLELRSCILPWPVEVEALEELHLANPLPYPEELVVTGYIIAELIPDSQAALPTRMYGNYDFLPDLRLPGTDLPISLKDGDVKSFSCQWTSRVSWPKTNFTVDQNKRMIQSFAIRHLDSDDDIVRSLERHVFNQEPLLVSLQSRAGDLVVSVDTARGPIVLRRAEGVENYTYVGCAWFMFKRGGNPHNLGAEIFSFKLKDRGWKKQTFRLV